MSVAGMIIEKEVNDTTKYEPSLNVISNSSIIMNKLNELEILSLKIGTINGISGILLNESIWKRIDVIVFVVEVISKMPNFRAAANAVQAISKLYPKSIVK